MLFNIFFGIFLMAVGLAMMKFWRNIYNFTGAIDFVERLVTAGTPAFIRILGVVLVVFGLGMIFGIWSWLTQPIADSVKGLTGAELNK